MKKILYMSLLSAILAAPLSGERSFSGKILVLGFDSPQMTQVQDRMLRESLMRELRKSGYEPVPVMETESLFLEDESRQIRKIGDGLLKQFCLEAGAGCALTGKMYPKSVRVKKEKGIKKNRVYVFEMRAYVRETEKFLSFRTESAGEKDLYDFFNKTAEAIAAGLVKNLD